MDSGHPDKGNGDRGASGEDNVVRLPREWLGPIEELVPIGTTARGRAADGAADTVEAAPSASAFWSADAAALHSAVQGPTTEVSIAAAPAGSPSAPWPGAGRRRLMPRLLGHWPAWAQVRLWPVLAGLAVAAIAVIGLLGRLESGSGRLTTADAHLGAGRAATSAPVSSTSPGDTSPGALDEPVQKASTYTELALQAARREAAPLLRSRQGQARRNATSHHDRSSAGTSHRPADRALHSHRSSAPPVHPAPVQPAPAQTAPSYAPPEQSSTPAPQTVNTVAPTGAATDAVAPTKPASPVRHASSQPAFGNKGTLGPGSSPDS